MEETDRGYLSLPHEKWCDLLSTLEAKDNRKSATYQIKRLASPKAAPASDIDGSHILPGKKKVRARFILSCNPIKKAPKNLGTHSYYIMFNKAVMLERKYM